MLIGRAMWSGVEVLSPRGWLICVWRGGCWPCLVVSCMVEGSVGGRKMIV